MTLRSKFSSKSFLWAQRLIIVCSSINSTQQFYVMDSNDEIQSDDDTNSILGDNADIDVNDSTDAANNSSLFCHPLAIFTFAI